MKNTKGKNEKCYRITEAQYLEMRRDKKAKMEIKALAFMLFNKTKNWK